VPFVPVRLRTTEEKLHVLGGERFHGLVVRVDSGVNHVSLLLLNQHHSTFDRILDTQAGDRAGPGLSNAMASISRLPLSSWIPPSI
jgi:hypothetical protein